LMTQRQKVNKVISEAAGAPSTSLVARGLPELPNTTPHTLRRTYISIALLANRFDVLWVMRQVGHADSTMTMDVYARPLRARCGTGPLARPGFPPPRRPGAHHLVDQGEPIASRPASSRRRSRAGARRGAAAVARGARAR
jgi:hypothetical protein